MHYCVAIEEREGIKIAPYKRGAKSQKAALALLERALISLGFNLVYYISDETSERAYKKGNVTVVVNYATGIIASTVTCMELQGMLKVLDNAKKKPLMDYYL